MEARSSLRCCRSGSSSMVLRICLRTSRMDSSRLAMTAVSDGLTASWATARRFASPCLSSCSVLSRATSACRERTPTEGASHNAGAVLSQNRARAFASPSSVLLRTRSSCMNRLTCSGLTTETATAWSCRKNARPSWYVPVASMQTWASALPPGRWRSSHRSMSAKPLALLVNTLERYLPSRPEPRRIELHLADVDSYFACHGGTPCIKSQCATFDMHSLICGVVANAGPATPQDTVRATASNPSRSPVFIAGCLAQGGEQGLPNGLPSALREREEQYQEERSGGHSRSRAHRRRGRCPE
jgi:hypothetical protein